jgi:hypothetical protein
LRSKPCITSGASLVKEEEESTIMITRKHEKKKYENKRTRESKRGVKRQHAHTSKHSEIQEKRGWGGRAVVNL